MVYRYLISIGMTSNDTHAECWVMHRNRYGDENFIAMVNKCKSIVGDKGINTAYNNIYYLKALRVKLIELYGFSLPPHVASHYKLGE